MQSKVQPVTDIECFEFIRESPSFVYKPGCCMFVSLCLSMANVVSLYTKKKKTKKKKKLFLRNFAIFPIKNQKEKETH